MTAQVYHEIALIPVRSTLRTVKGKKIRKEIEGAPIKTFSYSGDPLNSISVAICEAEFKKFCEENSGWATWRLKFRHEVDNERKDGTTFPGWHPIPPLPVVATV